MWGVHVLYVFLAELFGILIHLVFIFNNTHNLFSPPNLVFSSVLPYTSVYIYVPTVGGYLCLRSTCDIIIERGNGLVQSTDG